MTISLTLIVVFLIVFGSLPIGMYLGKLLERRNILKCFEESCLYEDEYTICKASEYAGLILDKKHFEELRKDYYKLVNDKKWIVFSFIVSMGSILSCKNLFNKEV